MRDDVDERLDFPAERRSARVMRIAFVLWIVVVAIEIGLPWMFDAPRPLLIAIRYVATYGLLGWFAVLVLQIYRTGRLLRASDGLACPRCRYILRGLPPVGRCPECNRPYDHARLPDEWATAFHILNPLPFRHLPDSGQRDT